MKVYHVLLFILIGVVAAFIIPACKDKADPLQERTLKDGTRCIIWNNTSITCDWTGTRRQQSWLSPVEEMEQQLQWVAQPWKQYRCWKEDGNESCRDEWSGVIYGYNR